MKTSSIKYIVLFLGLIFIIDFTSGLLLKEKFNDISFGDYSIINKSLKSDAEVLILGSSRAMHHYNPIIFSETLKASSYNTGLGGYGLFLNYAILKERITTKAPKIVILDISPNVIVDKESYSKLNQLLPYYKKYASFKEIVQLNPKFSKLELVSNLYVHNSTIYDFARSSLLKSKDSNLGYKPLEGKIDKNSFEPFYLEDEEIDNNKMSYLNKIIDLCKKNEIRLIGIISPTYTKFDKENRIIDTIETMLNTNNIEFYNYSNYAELYLKANYFTDQLHMNSVGANIFSKDLAEKIKRD